jgi:hypothetical protein
MLCELEDVGMKMKHRSEQSNLSRLTSLYTVLASVVLSATVGLPPYRASSQGNVDGGVQGFRPLDSLPAQLRLNRDGSVSVSFRGKPGAVYEIYYSGELPTWLNNIPWTLIAKDVIAETNAWTHWVDAGGVKAVIRNKGIKSEVGSEAR